MKWKDFGTVARQRTCPGMELALDYRPGSERPAAGLDRERLEQQIGCLQAFVGHELLNVLVSCHGFAQLLGEQALRLDSEGQMHLERLQALTQKADRTSRRLEKIGRLLRGSPWGPCVALADVAREAVAEVNARGDLPGVDYRIVEPMPALAVSRPLMHAALVELVRNSARAALTTAAGQVEVTARLVPDGCLLKVRDNGAGLSAEQANLLLEPFAAARIPGACGAGLGFFLVRQAAARWGGLLRVHSEVGQGTTVELLVPARGQESGLRSQGS
jgi:signal transduction histidine kinase